MKHFYCCLLVLLSIPAFGQFRLKPLDPSDPGLPTWAKAMYSPAPNVFEVERLREAYYEEHPFEPTAYTAYYNHWRRSIQPYVAEDGSILRPDVAEKIRATAMERLAPWRFVGPEVNYRRRNSSADPVLSISWHANVYCIDRSISNPDVVYCGTENGGVYKSVDHGLTWSYLSLAYDHVTVTSIAVDPADENKVLCCADGRLYRTIDGGTTWNRISTGPFSNRTVDVWQILYHPTHSSWVFAGAVDSLYRSTDGGITWSGMFGGECQSVAFNPLDPSIVYALRYEAVDKIAYFYKSNDTGSTFNRKPTGWFSVPASDAGLIQSYGGRIAVTLADTSRVYVLLVGSSQSTAQLQLNGQIGVYRSNDGGESWTLPHGSIGAPYNASTHPNMMTFDGGNSTYNQIYYNTTLVASQVNPDRILIGGMSMWRSNDAGATFGPVGGYLGSVAYVHPDNQEFKIYKTSANTEEVWVASDGGINLSNNFMYAHQSRTQGIYGAAFWGFDQGWNDDIMVGGRYHNGNAARRDGYPDGQYIQLGGGEAATGYVNYSNEKRTYYSDINGVVLPDSIDGYTTSFGMDTDPNESYVDNASSRIMFDWDYWNVAYTGKDNRILKSTTSAQTFTTLYAFGTSTNDKVYWIEQSRVNTDLLYAQLVVNNRSQLWRSTDRGLTWIQIALPASRRELVFSLSGTNQDELWIAFPSGPNGAKIYRSDNGGAVWTNITTPVLDGSSVKAIAHQFGTDGGVYAATFHGPVYYRNRSMADWQAVGSGLPAASYPLRTVPFYRDNKLRLATWQLGIWETELYEPSSLIADFSADYQEFYCPGDTIRFVPHAVASSNAVYQWQFPGATPAAYTGMYPTVVYQYSGTFAVTLMVTDQGASDTITKSGFIRTVPSTGTVVSENFEGGSFDSAWRLRGDGSGGSNWTINSYASGFGIGTYSMIYDNFNIDAGGIHDAIWTSKCDLTSGAAPTLRFDVAYAEYSASYSDTLEVQVSSDCGQTFSTLYRKGGQTLATAPPNTAALFVPAVSEWRTDSIDLASYAGSSEVIISFVNIGRYGQAVYVDNIQLVTLTPTSVGSMESVDISLFPNPFDRIVEVKSSSKVLSMNMELVDLAGRVVFDGIVDRAGQVDVGDLAAGVYGYRLYSAAGDLKSGKLVKR